MCIYRHLRKGYGYHDQGQKAPLHCPDTWFSSCRIHGLSWTDRVSLAKKNPHKQHLFSSPRFQRAVVENSRSSCKKELPRCYLLSCMTLWDLTNTQQWDKVCTHRQAGVGTGVFSSDFPVCHQQPMARGRDTSYWPDRSQRWPAVVLRSRIKETAIKWLFLRQGRTIGHSASWLNWTIKYPPVWRVSLPCIYKSSSFCQILSFPILRLTV